MMRRQGKELSSHEAVALHPGVDHLRPKPGSGVSGQPFSRPKEKCAGMGVAEVRRLRVVEEDKG